MMNHCQAMIMIAMIVTLMKLPVLLDIADSQQDATSSDGDSSGSEDATSSEEEDETEDNFEQTNPLLEQIRENVSGVLYLLLG